MSNTTPVKINVVTLGCSKNLVDSEVLMNQFKRNQFEVLHDAEDFEEDITIINTCGFIDAAKQESIDTILHYIEAKEKGLIKGVFVMGCLSERYKQELEKDIPEVDQYFGVKDIESILKTFGVDYKKELQGERSLATPKHYAYLKVSEGCDWKCAFCAIPIIRGKHISKSIEAIVEEATALAAKGVKELILIAQDLTYYGLDLYKKRQLGALLKELEKIDGIEWIRLHYLYPANFPLDVLDIMAKSPKICKYIDIPFQHASDLILESMERRVTKAETQTLIDTIHEKVPGIRIRTSIIVGYPLEKESQFKELKQFVAQNKFERLGVFSYSHEEGTAAFSLGDKVSSKLKERRMSELMDIQQVISFDSNEEFIGKTLKVIVDREEEDYFIARTEFDSPEIDNEVLVTKNRKIKVGTFINVKIINAEEFDLFGELVK